MLVQFSDVKSCLAFVTAVRPSHCFVFSSYSRYTLRVPVYCLDSILFISILVLPPLVSVFLFLIVSVRFLVTSIASLRIELRPSVTNINISL